MKLPKNFIETMHGLLGAEVEAFFDSYNMPKMSGLRANGLKLSGDRLQRMSSYARTPIPWVEGGFYSSDEDRPGKHAHYSIGLYYIQEPSAMVPAELLGVRPGHRVLDLCAAPGGKTTQLGAKLQGTGCLVTNDNAVERTKALAKNVERAGITNAVVLGEEPNRIADRFGAFFDRVLVDAPCSGEGMFRKDEDMVRQWERHTVEKCAIMQQHILKEAARLVAPGGRLLYSTCTFSPRENEGSIARFLHEFPQFTVVPIITPTEWGFAPGRPDWLNEEEAALLSEEQRNSLTGAIRIWPHRSKGEGHFAVLLELKPETGSPDSILLSDSGKSVDARGGGEAVSYRGGKGKRSRETAARKEAVPEAADVKSKFAEFIADTLPGWTPPGKIVIRGSHVYSQPELLPELTGLNAVRPGWLLGVAGKHRFEPSQPLAMGLQAGQAARSLHLNSDDPNSIRYLKGETLHPSAAEIVGPHGEPASGKGWALVCIDGFPAGWGRWDGTMLKNELLPGWRWV